MSSNNNGFDSINLASTIHSRSPRKPLQSLVPASTTEEEDDEYEDDMLEEEFDPEEFILSQKEDTSINSHEKRTRTPSILQSTPFLDDSKLMKSFDSHMDSIFNDQENSYPINFSNLHLQNNNSAIEFLSGKIRMIFNELSKDTKLYEQFLNDGNPNIDKLRNKILDHFNHLSESYLSLNELYYNDKAYSETLFKSFKSWDTLRFKILSKVKSIKSEKSKYGKKLEGLLDQSKDLDTEIAEQELKLKNMRYKKLLLVKEIEDTSSVLESKTARYISTFRDLETQGKEAMYYFLQYNGIPETEFDTVIQTEKVDVTFLTNYASHNNQTDKVQAQSDIVQKESKNSNNQPNNTTGIGAQPFNPENLIIQNHDTSLLNHEHGPTPYEKGFAKGTQNSAQLRRKFENLFKKIIDSLPDNTSQSQVFTKSKIDDYSNTISEKLNLKPILDYLQLKSEALNDLIIQTSSKSVTYHTFSDCWDNVIKLLSKQEQKLNSILIESLTDQVNEEVVKVLNTTLDQLQILLRNSQHLKCETKEELIQKTRLLNLIDIDINAVNQGLNLVSNKNAFKDKLGFKNSFNNIPSFSEPTSQVQKVNSGEVKSNQKQK